MGFINKTIQGIYNSYLLALREFGLDEYYELEKTILLFLFITNIIRISLFVLLNILINLICSVYEDVIEEKEPSYDCEISTFLSTNLRDMVNTCKQN